MTDFKVGDRVAVYGVCYIDNRLCGKVMAVSYDVLFVKMDETICNNEEQMVHKKQCRRLIKKHKFKVGDMVEAEGYFTCPRNFIGKISDPHYGVIIGENCTLINSGSSNSITVKTNTMKKIEDIQKKQDQPVNPQKKDGVFYGKLIIDDPLKEIESFDPKKPVQTRDGRKARIICCDSEWGNNVPVLALIDSGHGTEILRRFSKNGFYCDKGIEKEYRDNEELVNIPEPKPIYLHVGGIYRLRNGKMVFCYRKNEVNKKYPFTCFYLDYQGQYADLFTNEGKFRHDFNMHPSDIIEQLGEISDLSSEIKHYFEKK